MSRFYAQLTLLITGLILVGFGCSSDTSQKARPAPADSAAPADSIVITQIAPDTTTVFDLLAAEHRVESRSTALGVFVQQIDSIAGGQGAYWVFSVNDTTPMVAADKCQVVPGDTVQWRLRFSAE